MSKLLKPAEAAAILNVTTRTVRNLVARRALRAVRVGRTLRIDERDLTAFVEKQRRDSDNVVRIEVAR